MTDQELDSFFQQTLPVPESVSENIRAQILSGTRPAKPVMNDWALAFMFVFVLLAISVIAGASLGFTSWHVLPGAFGKVLIGALLMLASCVAVMMARAMRPGTGIIYSFLCSAVVLASYELLLFIFFRNYSHAHFLSKGLVCLSLGSVCGLLAMLPIWFIARRGFVVEPGRAGAMMGLLGGISGLITLTIHCGVVGVAHSAVWHAAVLIVCVAAGATVLKPKPQ